MRSSPYIGWFRHAPPSSMRLHKVDHREITLSEKCQALALILASLPSSRSEKSRPEFADFVSGRLSGGGKDAYYVRDAFDDPVSAENASATANMLAKLGSWFIAPLTQDAEALYKACYDDRNLKLLTQDVRQVNDDSDSDDEQDEENDDDSIVLSDFDGPVTPMVTVAPTTTDSISKPVDISLSEIAEAYYAHQVIDQSEYSSLEGDRLDYVITQADIARMARNAARHLDVDSILNLPTTTFRAKKCLKRIPESNAADSRDPEEAWSFIMVPKNTSKSTEQSDDVNGTECVICLEAFVEGDRLRVLPCDHSFHVGCIDRWLSGSHSHHECITSGCPTCKKRPSPAATSNRAAGQKQDNNGSVPSWAFAKLGFQMSQSQNE